MKKMSLALFAAGAMAAAGVTQAETFDVPQQAGEASTMTHGAPNLVTTNSPYGDNTVIVGSTPMVVTSPAYVVSGPAVVDTTVLGAGPVLSDTQVTIVDHGPMVLDRDAAAGTFNVPARAGEASTMTGGAPNMSTDNSREIIRSGEPVVIWRQ